MLKVNMLGTLSFELNGELLRLKLGERGCLLSCYMVQFKGLLHRRDHLTELFWPDLPADKARAAFNNATWRLRKLLQLDPAVGCNKLRRIGDDFMLENCDQISPDTHELSWAANRVMQHERGEVLRADEETAIASSVQNYRGPFLDGVDLPWVLPERAHLHELCVRIQNYLIRASVARTDYDSALLQARRMASVDPLNEHSHGDVMLLLLLIGRQAEAVRCYEKLQVLLRTELGIKPMPETQRLADLIRSGDVFNQIDALVAARFRRPAAGEGRMVDAA
jgi:DNA-binding SARP family transcriptional activator